jgi:hypothetical protein
MKQQGSVMAQVALGAKEDWGAGRSRTFAVPSRGTER